jgi:uncharacterized protein (TIGR03067 family)
MLALLLIASTLTLDNRTDPDLAKLEGTWKVLRLTADGVESPREEVQKGRYVIRGNELSAPEPGNPENKMSFTIDSSKSPKEIDITVLEGKAKGKKFQCIYKLEGDRLTICAPQGKQESVDLTRPEGFDGGQSKSLVVLERIEGR